jgi:DNA-binding NtrC family response regulator
VLSRLVDYPWPGNVRELENVIERAAVLCRGEAMTLDDLPRSDRSRLGPCALRFYVPDWNAPRGSRAAPDQGNLEARSGR